MIYNLLHCCCCWWEDPSVDSHFIYIAFCNRSSVVFPQPFLELNTVLLTSTITFYPGPVARPPLDQSFIILDFHLLPFLSCFFWLTTTTTTLLKRRLRKEMAIFGRVILDEGYEPKFVEIRIPRTTLLLYSRQTGLHLFISLLRRCWIAYRALVGLFCWSGNRCGDTAESWLTWNHIRPFPIAPPDSNASMRCYSDISAKREMKRSSWRQIQSFRLVRGRCLVLKSTIWIWFCFDPEPSFAMAMGSSRQINRYLPPRGLRPSKIKIKVFPSDEAPVVKLSWLREKMLLRGKKNFAVAFIFLSNGDRNAIMLPFGPRRQLLSALKNTFNTVETSLNTLRINFPNHSAIFPPYSISIGTTYYWTTKQLPREDHHPNVRVQVPASFHPGFMVRIHHCVWTMLAIQHLIIIIVGVVVTPLPAPVRISPV